MQLFKGLFTSQWRMPPTGLNLESLANDAMAEKPKAPSPALYDRMLDKSIDDTLKDYHSFHTEPAMLEDQKERGQLRDALYSTVVGHLSQHGVDKKTGKLTRYGYHDMKEGDRTKWAQDLVHRLALVGVAKQFGENTAKEMASNHARLREYVENHMVTEGSSYEALIDQFANAKNLKEGFYEDEAISSVITNYLGSLSTLGEKRMNHRRHLGNILADKNNFIKSKNFVDKLLTPHKAKLSASANANHIVKLIETLGADKFKYDKRAKYLEEVEEKKK